MDVTLLFGSNQGDRKTIIEEAQRQMAAIGHLKTQSSLYETAPWGFESEDTFYNKAAVYTTSLSPTEVLRTCLEVEKNLGRKRTSARYSSRPIDIDIIFCDGQIIETPDLSVPHPRMAIRNFVLAPLNEIMPDFIHPVTHKPVATLLRECPDTLATTRLREEKATPVQGVNGET